MDREKHFAWWCRRHTKYCSTTRFINKTRWSSMGSELNVCSINSSNTCRPMHERSTLLVSVCFKLLARAGCWPGAMIDRKWDSLDLHSLMTSSDGCSRPPRFLVLIRPQSFWFEVEELLARAANTLSYEWHFDAVVCGCLLRSWDLTLLWDLRLIGRVIEAYWHIFC